MTDITWTNCSERMPPDDENYIIVKVSYIKPGVDYHPTGRIRDYIALASNAFLSDLHRYEKAQSKYWTPYTEEKWKELNEI